jgi:hypothetical protein
MFRCDFVGEVGRLHTAFLALEDVALNRNPADTDAAHLNRTRDAGVRLAKAVADTFDPTALELGAYDPVSLPRRQKPIQILRCHDVAIDHVDDLQFAAVQLVRCCRAGVMHDKYFEALIGQ